MSHPMKLTNLKRTFNGYFFHGIINLNTIFQVSKCSTKRALESRVMSHQERPDALVVVNMRTRRDEQGLKGGDPEQTNAAVR